MFRTLLSIVALSTFVIVLPSAANGAQAPSGTRSAAKPQPAVTSASRNTSQAIPGRVAPSAKRTPSSRCREATQWANTP